MVFVDVGGVVGDQVDTGNLLEGLVDVRKNCAVEMAIAFFV